MTGEELLISNVAWHFMTGNEHLDPVQWSQHLESGSCTECRDKTFPPAGAEVVSIDGMHAPGPDHPASMALSREDP